MSTQSFAVAPRTVAPVLVPRYAPTWSAAPRSSVAFGVALVGLGLVQVAAVVAGVAAGRATELWILVPLLALAVGYLRFQDAPVGPDIHDRQLDRILGAGAALGAATLLLVGASGSGHRLELLALPLTAVAVVTSRFGTRKLWQLRSAVLALVVVWPAPWAVAAAALEQAGAGRALAVGAVTGAMLAVPVTLASRTGWARRGAALLVAGTAGAGGARLADVVDPTVGPTYLVAAALLCAALVLLALLPPQLLRPTAPAVHPSAAHDRA